MNLTDRELLARTIMAEAGNQGPVGMMGVGSVIMNRLQNPSYGNDFTSVILQPGQFSAWNSVTGYAGGAQGQNMSKIQPSEQAYMVADQILDGNYNDPTGGATHYYNPRISNPNWGQRSGGDWQQIGAHLFGVPGKKDPMRISTMNANNAPLNAIPSMGPVTQSNAQPKANPQAKPPRRGLFDFLGKAVGGTFGGLKGALDGSDPDKSDRLAIALMSLSGNPQQLQPLMQMAANDIQERKKTKANNKTVEYLKKTDPELGKLAEQNPSLAPMLMQEMIKARFNKGTALKQDYTFLKGLGLDDKEIFDMLRKGTQNNFGSDMQVSGDMVIIKDPSAPNGIRMVPIPGGKSDTDAKRAEKSASETQQSEAVRSKIILSDIDRAIATLEKTGLFDLPEAGIFGSRLADLGINQEAVQLREDLKSLKAKITFDRLDELRKASAVGASGLGAINVAELDLLSASLGSIDQIQDPKVLLAKLNEIRPIIEKIENSPVALEILAGGDAANVQTGDTQTTVGDPYE